MDIERLDEVNIGFTNSPHHSYLKRARDTIDSLYLYVSALGLRYSLKRSHFQKRRGFEKANQRRGRSNGRRCGRSATNRQGTRTGNTTRQETHESLLPNIENHREEPEGDILASVLYLSHDWDFRRTGLSLVYLLASFVKTSWGNFRTVPDRGSL